MKKMTGHQGVIYSLDFSQDGSILISGSADCTVRAWDVKREPTPGQGTHRILQDGRDVSGVNGVSGGMLSSPTLSQGHTPALSKKLAIAAPLESDDHLASFPTKRTPMYKVQFTKRNLCLAVGAFSGN